MGFATKDLSRKQLVIITVLVLIFIVAPLTLYTAMNFALLKRHSKYTKIHKEQMERNSQMQERLVVFQKAFDGIVFYDQSPKLYSFEADTLDFDYPSVSFVSRVPPDFPGSKDFGGQAMRRIQFAVEDEEAGGLGRRELVMYQTPILKPPDGLALAEPERWVLVPDLAQFYIGFWSNTESEWIPDWEETSAIPTRIKIEVASNRPDGTAPHIEDIHKLEIALFTESITQDMQSPRIPSPPRGRAKGSSGRGSGKSSPTTPHSVAGLKKVPERVKHQEAKKSGDTRSRYTPEQITRYRKAMAERSAGTRGIPGGNTLPPGMVSGELGLLLYKGAASSSQLPQRLSPVQRNNQLQGTVSGELGLRLYTGKEPPPLTPETQPSPPTRGNNRPTGLISGELGLLLHTGPRPSSPPQQKNTVPTRRGTPPR